MDYFEFMFKSRQICNPTSSNVALADILVGNCSCSMYLKP